MKQKEIGLCVRSDVGCCVRGRGVNGVAEKVVGSKQEPRLELRILWVQLRMPGEESHEPSFFLHVHWI